LWNEIEKSVKTAAIEVLVSKERGTRNIRFDQQCKIANTERDFARTKMLQDPSKENK